MSALTFQCVNFNKSIQIIMDSLSIIQKDVTTVDVFEVTKLVNSYSNILNCNDDDFIAKYEASYKELNNYISNKRDEIKEIEMKMNQIAIKYGSLQEELREATRNNKISIHDAENKIVCLSRFIPNEMFGSVLNDMKNNVNQVIDCFNCFVERIVTLLPLFKEHPNGFGHTKIKKYVVVHQSTPKNQSLLKTQPKLQLTPPKDGVNDFEMNAISNSMKILLRWCYMKTHKILFDSSIDGDGKDGILFNKVYQKKNICFISSNNEGDVFGGFINALIKKCDDHWTSDSKAFVFSLVRRNITTNKMYYIDKGKKDRAFKLFNKKNVGLYQFGCDLFVGGVTDPNSWVNTSDYKYDDRKPLSNHDPSKPFQMKRVIIIQLCK